MEHPCWGREDHVRLDAGIALINMALPRLPNLEHIDCGIDHDRHPGISVGSELVKSFFGLPLLSTLSITAQAFRILPSSLAALPTTTALRSLTLLNTVITSHKLDMLLQRTPEITSLHIEFSVDQDRYTRSFDFYDVATLGDVIQKRTYKLRHLTLRVNVRSVRSHMAITHETNPRHIGVKGCVRSLPSMKCLQTLSISPILLFGWSYNPKQASLQDVLPDTLRMLEMTEDFIISNYDHSAWQSLCLAELLENNLSKCKMMMVDLNKVIVHLGNRKRHKELAPRFQKLFAQTGMTYEVHTHSETIESQLVATG